MDSIIDVANELAKEAPVVETAPAETPTVEISDTQEAQPAVEAPATDVNDGAELIDITTEDTPAEVSTQTTTTPSDIFKEKFGKSEDEVLQEWKELQQLKEKGTYKTEFAKTFDELYSKGVPADTITQFGTLDISKMNDLDAISFKLQIEHPELSKEERDAIIQRKYPINDDMLSEQDKLAYSAQLKIDGVTAKAELEKVRGQKLQPVDLSNIRNEQAEAQEAQRIATWSKKSTEVAKAIGKLEVPLTYSAHGENGKTDKKQVNFAYTLNDKDRAEIAETVNTITSNLQINADDEGFKLAQQMAVSAFKANNFERLLNLAASKLASRMYEEQIQKTHNPQAPKGVGQGQMQTGQTAEGMERFMATIKNL